MCAAGLSGDFVSKGIPSHVDASFSNIFEHLELGGAGRFTGRYQRWVLSTDLNYMKLGPSTDLVDVTVEQWLVEPTVGYQFCDSFQAFAGLRYNRLSGNLAFKGPQGRIVTGAKEWADPIIGVQPSCPLYRDELSFDGRYDIGGFGAASDFTWQAYPHLNWRFSEFGSAQFGYRWLGTDYETGAGQSRFKFDAIAQGPQLGVTFHF